MPVPLSSGYEVPARQRVACRQYGFRVWYPPCAGCTRRKPVDENGCHPNGQLCIRAQMRAEEDAVSGLLVGLTETAQHPNPRRTQ